MKINSSDLKYSASIFNEYGSGIKPTLNDVLGLHSKQTRRRNV